MLLYPIIPSALVVMEMVSDPDPVSTSLLTRPSARSPPLTEISALLSPLPRSIVLFSAPTALPNRCVLECSLVLLLMYSWLRFQVLSHLLSFVLWL